MGVEMRKRDESGRFVTAQGAVSGHVSVELNDGPTSAHARLLKSYTRKRVALALPEIVTTFVKRATAGSVPHARALATLGGLDQREDAEKQTEPRRGKTLGRRLIEELDAIKARKAAAAERAAQKAEAAEEAAAAQEKNGEAGEEQT